MLRQIGTEQGLPSNSVSALVLDREQFLWVATARGLVRFDGKHYRVWQSEPAMPKDVIETLFVDRHNQIWMSFNEQGACVLKADRYQLRCFNRQEKPSRRLPGNRLFAFAETRAGVWLALFGDGLVLVDPVSLQVKTTLVLPAPNVFAAATINNDLYLLSFDGVLQRLPHNADLSPQVAQLAVGPNLGRRQPLRAASPFEVLTIKLAAPAIALFADQDARALYVGLGNGGGVVRAALNVQGAPDRIQHWKTQTRVALAFAKRDQQILAATEQGLLLIDRNGKSPPRLLSSVPGSTLALPEGMLTAIATDHQQGVWIASSDSGLAYWSVLSNGQEWLLRGEGGLPGAHVTSAVQSADGQLWVGMYSRGLATMDRQARVRRVPVKAEGDAIDAVWALASHGKDLWIGHGRGLTRHDTASGQQRHWQDQGAHKLVDLIDAHDDGVWLVSGRSNLVLLNAELAVQQRLEMLAVTGEIEQIQRREGELLIAAQRGFFRLRLSKAAKPIGALDRIVDDQQVYAFATCPNDPERLWLALDQALIQIDPQGQRIRAIARIATSKNDIGGMVCWLDARGQPQLYQAGPGGIWRLQVADGANQRIDLLSRGVEFNDRPFQVIGDQLYVGSHQGLLRLDPRVAAPKLADFPVHIDRCCHAGLTLGWRDAPLKLHAMALNYAAPQASDLRFVIASHDGTSKFQVQAEELTLPALTAGNYQIYAIAPGMHEQSSQRSPTLSLYVQAPPWQRWWGVALIAITALLFTYGAMRWVAQRKLRILRGQVVHEKAELMQALAAARTESMSYVSHEMRNLLNGVTGNAELLKRGASRQQLQWVARIEQAGNSLASLLDDVHDYSKLVGAQFQLQSKAFDLSELLQSVLDSQRGAAEGKGIRLVAEFSISAKWRMGDALRIGQVLTNLLSNAIKFTASGSVRLLAHRTQNDEIAFAVHDTGTGIPPERWADVFKPYVRVNANQSGSGLGLAICRELVARMGGELQLRQSDQNGSVFDFTVALPMVGNPPIELDCQLPPMVILVIEDEQANQIVLHDMLSGQGHHVLLAHDVFSALSAIQLGPAIDVLLLDLDLSGVDGLDVYGILAIQPKLQNAFALALTGRVGPEIQASCRAAGLAGFIAKPYRYQKIARAIISAREDLARALRIPPA